MERCVINQINAQTSTWQQPTTVWLWKNVSPHEPLLSRHTTLIATSVAWRVRDATNSENKYVTKPTTVWLRQSWHTSRRVSLAHCPCSLHWHFTEQLTDVQPKKHSQTSGRTQRPWRQPSEHTGTQVLKENQVSVDTASSLYMYYNLRILIGRSIDCTMTVLFEIKSRKVSLSAIYLLHFISSKMPKHLTRYLISSCFSNSCPVAGQKHFCYSKHIKNWNRDKYCNTTKVSLPE